MILEMIKSCPHCEIPRSDIGDAITCESLRRKEMREARLEAQTVEAEAEYSS
jgi:hypothetical protein